MFGHGAGTPLKLADWWTRYIVPPGGTVLDPFGGSGTTGDVASGNGRRAVLIELNPEYTKLAQDRCGLFCTTGKERA
jgi:site-specific DNA-methyltransferase (adenine-specific)